MARRFLEELSEWSKGALVTEKTAERIPLNTFPRARNTVIVNEGYPAKRNGLSLFTPNSPESAKAPILALGSFLNINWTIDDDGRWTKVDAGGVYSPMGATFVQFTPGTHYPSTAIANNHLFVVNGFDAKKTNGTTVSKFGMDAPLTPSVTDSAIAGNPSGSYYFGLTAYNANTGHESSLSTTVNLSVTNTKITVGWTFPTDPQVTHVRVHIFKEGLTDRFFRLTNTNVTPTTGTYDSAAGGYSSATVEVTVDVTDANINDLIIQSPSTTENNPPPVGTKFIWYHGSRMFATDGSKLYYSKLGDPESFDPANNEPVNTQDGQDILAFATLVDHHLIIWKEQSCYMLTGPDDPNTWEIVELDLSVGLASIRSIIVTENSIWWEALQGLFQVQYSALGGVSTPKRMDAPDISDRIENVNDAFMDGACGAYDSLRQRLLFAVPLDEATRNEALLPYNLKYKLFEDIWDPMDVSALGVFQINESPTVVIGGYGGRVFLMNTLPFVDGVRLANDAGTPLTVAGTIKSSLAIDQVVTVEGDVSASVLQADVATGVEDEWIAYFVADRHLIGLSSTSPSANYHTTLRRQVPGSSMAAFDSENVDDAGLFTLVANVFGPAVGFAISLAPAPSATISFDAASHAAQGANPAGTAHTTHAAATMMLAFIRTSGGVVSGVTYNGVAMTQVTATVPMGGSDYSVWSLQNPASGTHNIVVTGPTTLAMAAVTYKGVGVADAPNRLTDAAASFDTDDEGLTEIAVVVVLPSGNTMRNVVVSNTSTVLTLLKNWDQTPPLGALYYIGSPNFEFDTKHVHPTSAFGQAEGSVFWERTFKEILVKGFSDSSTATLDVYTILDGDLSLHEALHLTIPLSTNGALWDVALWDVDTFGIGRVNTFHTSLGLAGQTLGLRFRNITHGEGIILLGVGIMGSELSFKG